MSFPNMLYGRVLKSPHAHAHVKSIDVSKAEKMGAVTITPDEIPDQEPSHKGHQDIVEDGYDGLDQNHGVPPKSP